MPVYTDQNKLSNHRPKDEIKNATKYFIPHGLFVLPNHADRFLFTHPSKELTPAAAILTGKQIKSTIYDYAKEIGIQNLHLRIKDCIAIKNWHVTTLELIKMFTNEGNGNLQYVYLAESGNNYPEYYKGFTRLIATRIATDLLPLELQEWAPDSVFYALVKARLQGTVFK